MSEHWVESIVMKVPMLISSVMVEVDEVLNVVVRTDELNVLKHNKCCSENR